MAAKLPDFDGGDLEWAQARLSFGVEPASLPFEGRGPVWGRVYIHAGDSWFPERRWEDVAVPVAAAWLQAVVNLVRESQSNHG